MIYACLAKSSASFQNSLLDAMFDRVLVKRHAGYDIYLTNLRSSKAMYTCKKMHAEMLEFEPKLTVLEIQVRALDQSGGRSRYPCWQNGLAELLSRVKHVTIKMQIRNLDKCPRSQVHSRTPRMTAKTARYAAYQQEREVEQSLCCPIIARSSWLLSADRLQRYEDASPILRSMCVHNRAVRTTP